MNIYVGNLARTVTEDALKAAFQEFGEVTTVKIIKDRFTGEVKGFGFVQMPVPAEAQKAISQMNGRELEGQRLRVNEAREPEARAPRPGGGGNGNGRSGGGWRPNRGFGN
jgi:RNA recognition motif-containing protein